MSPNEQKERELELEYQRSRPDLAAARSALWVGVSKPVREYS